MGKSNYLKDNKELMNEYNFTKNSELEIDKLKLKSNKKVWWKCNKGHEWQATVASRTNGTGCPYCSNQKILVGYNDLKTTNSRLMEEWNYEKNIGIKPTEFTAGSNKKVWWKCEKGHEWETTIVNRVKGTGCPYCSGRRAIVGETDLETLNSELAKEWNYEKNYNLIPSDVSFYSNRKVWWRCEKGHEWEATIVNRSKNRGCPYCANKKIISGYNDLATTNPELIKEWNYEKNKSIDPKKIPAGSGKKVWWKCKKGHEWQATIAHRARGIVTNCPLCDKEKHISLPEKIVYFYIKKYFKDALENYSPEGFKKRDLDIFIKEKKVGIEYDGAYYHKNSKTDFNKDLLCEKGKIKLFRIRESKCKKYESSSIKIYVSENNIEDLANAIKKILCDLGVVNPTIEINKDLSNIYNMIDFNEKLNSLAVVDQKLSLEWNYERNGNLTPELVKSNSGKLVWWKCKKGHEWQATINNRMNGKNCPYCSNQRVLIGYNDLATTNPTITREWNYEKNGDLKPSDVTAGSSKKIWWKCEKGHEWETAINQRTGKKHTNCPYCSNKKILLGYNDLESKYPNLSQEWNYKKNQPLKPNEVVFGSGKKVWWKCDKCGKEWQTTIVKRTKRGQGCPVCAKKK